MFRSLAVLALVFSASAAFAGGKPFPDREAIETNKRLVAETFRKELQAGDKAPAVRAMLDAASQTDGDDPAQAALYLSAAEVAARIGDTRLAFQAVDQLASLFDCDVLAVKHSLLELAAKVARSNDARVSVANRGLELADAAAQAGRFDVADDALKTASAASAKVRDAELRKQITAKRKDVEKARKQADHTEHEIAAATKALEDDPNDPAANESFGKHLAFDRNQWSAGLKYLAKSTDANLRKLALADLKGAQNGNESATLGDAWYAIGESSDSARDKAGYHSRAAFWYTRAVNDLKGFAKTRIEKRLSEMQDALAAAATQDGGENGKYIDVTLAPGVLMRLVKIPASKDGKIPEFYLGQTEVTQRQWQVVMGSNPSTIMGDNLPVTDVSQKDCISFAEKLSANGRFVFRLPTKDEWLNAYDSDVKSAQTVLESIAWHKSNGDGKMHPVGQKNPGKLGLLDIAGNAFELTADPVHIYGGSIAVPIQADRTCFVQDFPNGDKHVSVGFRLCAELR